MMVAGFFFFKNMTDPAKISSIANTFMTVDMPLPDGNNYVAGSDIVIPFVVINNSNTGTVYTFFQSPPTKTSGEMNAEDAIDAIASGKEAPNVPGGSGATTSPRQLKVAKRDQLIVGGLKMPYVLGSTAKAGGGENGLVDMFFGAVKTPSNKVIFLMGQQTDPNAKTKKSLTVENVQGLTGAIKSWK